jgi:hypothetical protein
VSFLAAIRSGDFIVIIDNAPNNLQIAKLNARKTPVSTIVRIGKNKPIVRMINPLNFPRFSAEVLAAKDAMHEGIPNPK